MSTERTAGNEAADHPKDWTKIIKDEFFHSWTVFDNFSGTFGLLAVVFSSFQELAVVYTTFRPIQWHNGFSTWLDEFMDAILLRRTFFANSLAIYATWTLVGVLVVQILTVSMLRRSTYHQWIGLLLRCSNILLHFLATIALLPMASTLGSSLSCSSIFPDSTLSPGSACWSNSSAYEPILSLIIFIVLVILMISEKLLLVEQVSYDTKYLSMAHGRVRTIESVSNAVLIFLFSSMARLVIDSSSARWAYNIIALAATGFGVVLNIAFAPYYFHFFQIFRTSVSCFNFWSCFSLVLLEIVPPSGYEPAVLVYLCGTLAILLGYWLLGYRQRKVFDTPIDKLRYDFEVEMKVRFYLIKQDRFWTRQEASLENSKNVFQEESYRAAAQMYKDGLAKFHESSLLCLSYGSYLYGKGNYNFCLTTFAKCKRMMQTDPDVEFAVFSRSRQIERIFTLQKGTTEVKKYFRFLQLSSQVDMQQSRFIARKLAFLGELRKLNPNPRRIEIVALDFYQTLTGVQNMYREMFSINRSSKLLRKYATFLSNHVGHKAMTKQVVDMSDKMDSESKATESMHKTTGIESQAALFDDRNAVFLISGEEGQLGKILDVNIGAVDLFGFTASFEIIGTNINQHMPNPFSDMHMSYLKRYLESSISTVLDITRTLVAKNKMGYLFQVNLFVRQIVDDKGNINFIGVMAKTDEQPEFIIIDPNGHISAVSNSIGLLFAVEKLSQETPIEAFEELHSVHISEWITSWHSDQEKLTQEHGTVIEHNGRELHVKVQSLAGFGSNYSLIEIWVEEISNIPKTILNVPSHEVLNAARIESPRQEAKLLVADGIIGVVTDDRRASLVESQLQSNTMNILRLDSVDSERQSSIASDLEFVTEQNMALNSVFRFDSLIEDYQNRLEHRSVSSRGSRSFFKVLSFGLLAWLIAANVYYGTLFQGLKASIDLLMDEGNRDTESLRLRHSLRRLQVLEGCTPGYNVSVCSSLTGPSWSYADLDSVRNSMMSAATNFRDANHRMLVSLIQTSTSDDFFSQVGDFVYAPISLVKLDEVGNAVEFSASLFEAVEYLAASGLYLANDPSQPTFQVDYNNVIPIWDPSFGYFLVNDTGLWRSAFYVNANMRNIEIDLENLNTIYQSLFKTQLSQVTNTFKIMSVLPTIVMLLGLLFFIIPDAKKSIDWHSDILETFFNIPRSLVQYWYSNMVHKIEQETRDDDQGITAEIFMYLQNDGSGEAGDDIMDLQKSGNPEKHNKKAQQEEAVRRETKQTLKKVTFGTSLHSLNQTKRIVHFLISGVVLVLIPLLSLATIPTLSSSTSIAAQMHIANFLIIKMYRTYFNLAEGINNHFTNLNIQSVYLTRTRSELAAFDLAVSQFVYGDGGDVIGLSSDPTFAEILTGPSCNYVDGNLISDLFISEPCEDFENGLLNFGLSEAMSDFHRRVDLLLDKLLMMNTTDASSSLVSIEGLMFQISSVIISTRPLISEKIVTSAQINQNILTPVELIVAFIVAAYLYFWVYIPLMESLDKSTQNLHNVLMLMWSITDGSSANRVISLKDKPQELAQKKNANFDTGKNTLRTIEMSREIEPERTLTSSAPNSTSDMISNERAQPRTEPKIVPEYTAEADENEKQTE